MKIFAPIGPAIISSPVSQRRIIFRKEGTLVLKQLILWRKNYAIHSKKEQTTQSYPHLIKESEYKAMGIDGPVGEMHSSY